MTQACIDDRNTTELLDSLESLNITAPMESDEEFMLNVTVTADTNETLTVGSAMVNVTVLADRHPIARIELSGSHLYARCGRRRGLLRQCYWGQPDGTRGTA